MGTINNGNLEFGSNSAEVDSLIINTVGSGTPTTNLGVDSSGNVVSGSSISTGEPVFETINIGDWNMDATTSITVAHSLSATEWKTIRSLGAIIRNDADTTYYIFSGPGGSNPQDGTIVSFNSTNVNLGRNTGGIYNSTSFDSTSYNRGWVTFWYTPD
jgi:hypothetical protein